MDEYRVSLPEFHGPLDLLLHLVKRNEIDVCEIPIAVIADQFRAYLELLSVIDVELTGDFLVTAATLMEIKSRMLLPQQPTEAQAEAEIEDPRTELVKQLLEYKRFKEAAARLENRAAQRERRLPRKPVDVETQPGQPTFRPVELWDLLSAFGRLVQEAEELEPEQVVDDETPQEVYRERVLMQARQSGRIIFRNLFTPPYFRVRIVGIFLAILELIKSADIAIEQAESSDEIWIAAISQSETP